MGKEKEIPINEKGAERDEPVAEQAPGRTDSDAPESEPVAKSNDFSAESAELGAEEKIAKLEDRLLRTVAEFDNFKKRTANQYAQMTRSANEKLLFELLEVIDNFERALQHNNGDADSESIRKGTELIYNQLLGILNKYDVTPIESVGQPFDPNLHEAMMQTPSEEYDEGCVAMEIGKGYMLGDRVLRHSKVAVSTGPPGEDSSGSEK